MRALASPASLKGVLSAGEAASALARGLRRAGVEAEELAVADGGEGTGDVIAAALGGEWRRVTVSDPLGRPVEARWLRLSDGRALVESAEAIGLGRLHPDELDPFRATSRGLGELIDSATEHKPSSLFVCLGGSATVDGGAGVREVLQQLPVETTVLCDVRNPLLGERGAARAFGPQKGASPEAVEELEARLASMRELAPYAKLPGAGSAGGLGATFAALGARLVAGADFVLEVIGFRERLPGVDLVVTGEGTVDRSTTEGKAPGAVWRASRERGARCAIFGGQIAEPIPDAELHELSGDPARAREDLRALGERLGCELRE